MPSRDSKRWLLAALKKIMVTELELRGFKNIQNSKELDHETRIAHPFGRFIRTTSKVHEIVDIELAPYGQAKFRMNAGYFTVVDLTQIFANRGKPEDVWTGLLRKYYTLGGRGGYFNSWFRVHKWFWQTQTKEDYEKLVETAATYFVEIEDALATGKTGKHIGVTDCDLIATKTEKRRALINRIRKLL